MLDWESTRSAVEIISRKWHLCILAQLETGPARHVALVEATALDHKTLDRALRKLEDEGLVAREVYIRRPLRVRYGLTTHARSLLRILDELAIWWDEREKSSVRRVGRI